MYRPPELQEIIDRYMAETDIEAADKIAIEFLQFEYDNCLSVPLWDWVAAQFLQPWIHDAGMKVPDGTVGIGAMHGWKPTR
jgi:hypothetical protein